MADPFFFVNKPEGAVVDFIRPAEENTTESGIQNRRFAGVAYWQGEFDYPVQRQTTGSILAEFERASSAGGVFYADLYNTTGAARVNPVWLPVVVDASNPNSNKSFAVASSASSSPFADGAIASFRRVVPGSASLQAAGKRFVTARVISGRSASGANFIYRMESELPTEFAPVEGAVIEVCFNRPHVRAYMDVNAIQWSARPGFTRPASVGWKEDIGGNLTFLHDALRSPGGGGPTPFNELLITENAAAFLATEDGKFITTEE